MIVDFPTDPKGHAEIFIDDSMTAVVDIDFNAILFKYRNFKYITYPVFILTLINIGSRLNDPILTPLSIPRFYFTILSINRIHDKLQSKNEDFNDNTSKNSFDILTSLTRSTYILYDIIKYRILFLSKQCNYISITSEIK